MHNHHSEPHRLPVNLALPAMNLASTSGAQSDGRATNEATATLIDTLTGQYIKDATITFSVNGNALFTNNLNFVSANTNALGVATVYLTSSTTETVTVIAQYGALRQEVYTYFIPVIPETPDYSILTRIFELNLIEAYTGVEYLVFDNSTQSSVKGRIINIDIFREGVYYRTMATDIRGLLRVKWSLITPTYPQFIVTLALQDNPEIRTSFTLPKSPS